MEGFFRYGDNKKPKTPWADSVKIWHSGRICEILKNFAVSGVQNNKRVPEVAGFWGVEQSLGSKKGGDRKMDEENREEIELIADCCAFVAGLVMVVWGIIWIWGV